MFTIILPSSAGAPAALPSPPIGITRDAGQPRDSLNDFGSSWSRTNLTRVSSWTGFFATMEPTSSWRDLLKRCHDSLAKMWISW